MLGVRQARRWLTKSTIRHQVASGRWQRPHFGVLVTHNGELTDRQRLWIASLAAGDGEPAPLGGLSALRAHGLIGFEPPSIFVLLRADQRHRRPPKGVSVRRTTTLGPRDVFTGARPPRTRPPRSIVDAAAWARSDREARGIIATAFQQGFVRLDDVLDAVARQPRARRRTLTATTARDAAGGATSLGELDLLGIIRQAGLPVPTFQHGRRDADGRQRYLDGYYERYRLHLEIDGAHHTNPTQVWADMARQNALWVTGDRVLRFPAWLVRDRPEVVVAQLRAALREAGWRG
ncbi:hypothetical protein GCM10009681_30050 [Luedemannella helvata]|uniref:DUF559 domain-containing protein n=1 Tax=Luedemannella helvata TaxID=349315 RepID=A0ABN2KKB9_9ACTN